MTEETKYFAGRVIGYGLIALALRDGIEAYALYFGLCVIDIWRKR